MSAIARISHRRFVVLALRCACAATVSLAAAATAAAGQGPGRPVLAAMATRQVLQPTLEALQEQARSDPELSGLLSRVRMTTYGRRQRHLGHNAGATTVGGRPAVLVDLIYLAETVNIGAFAALGILQNDAAAPIIRSAMQEYEKAAAAQQPSEFVVDISDLGEGTALHDVAVRLGVEVGLTTAAWLVLHEVGHHVLGHLTTDIPDGEPSRAAERKADEWAYRKLYDLGFHLDFLDWYLMARAALEEVDLKYGLAAPEATSTHPLFATRRAELNRLFDVARATPVRTLAFVGTGWDGRGTPVMVEAIVPRRPDEDMQLAAAVWTGSVHSNQLFDWQDGAAHIYARSGDRLAEITIHHPERVRTKVTSRLRDLRTGEERTIERVWIQTSLVLQRRQRLGGVQASFMLDNPLGTVLREALRAAGIDASKSDAVVREFAAYFSELRKSLVRYARGESTLAAFAGTMDARSEQFSTRLRAMLGPQWSKAVEDALMANPRVLSMLDVLMKP